MKNILIENFNGEKVYNIFWKGRVCWIGIDIAKLLKYENPSKGIAHCILAEKFEIGKEYDVLKRDELKVFKNIILEQEKFSHLLRIPQLVILYEEGLYGILQYSQKDVAIDFKKWLRRVVLPRIRKEQTFSEPLKQTYIKESIEKKSFENINSNSLECMKVAKDTCEMFLELFKEDEFTSYEKIEICQSIFENVGIEIPIKSLKK